MFYFYYIVHYTLMYTKGKKHDNYKYKLIKNMSRVMFEWLIKSKNKEIRLLGTPK